VGFDILKDSGIFIFKIRQSKKKSSTLQVVSDIEYLMTTGSGKPRVVVVGGSLVKQNGGG
jgi:hypothetical protein